MDELINTTTAKALCPCVSTKVTLSKRPPRSSLQSHMVKMHVTVLEEHHS